MYKIGSLLFGTGRLVESSYSITRLQMYRYNRFYLMNIMGISSTEFCDGLNGTIYYLFTESLTSCIQCVWWAVKAWVKCCKHANSLSIYYFNILHINAVFKHLCISFSFCLSQPTAGHKPPFQQLPPFPPNTIHTELVHGWSSNSFLFIEAVSWGLYLN